MITLPKLLALAPKAISPQLQADALEAARQQSTITTPRRVAAWLGQIYVETGGFRDLTENFNYRDPRRLDALFFNVKGIEHARRLIAAGPEAIANCVYANRLGNGNEASGDGYRFAGAGHKQLTGRGNYRRIGQMIGMDLEGNPEQAADIPSSALIAARYWDACHCSEFADEGDLEQITERVNGPAKLGLKERRAATLRALEIWD